MKKSINPHTHTLKNGILDKLTSDKYITLLGELTTLMLTSPLHSKFIIEDIQLNFLPAIQCNQYRLYRNAKNHPIGLVTWAFLSDEKSRAYEKQETSVLPPDWQSGNNLWFIDFIVPHGHVKSIVKDLKAQPTMKGKTAKSLRFDADGNYIKTHTWRG